MCVWVRAAHSQRRLYSVHKQQQQDWGKQSGFQPAPVVYKNTYAFIGSLKKMKICLQMCTFCHPSSMECAHCFTLKHLWCLGTKTRAGSGRRGCFSGFWVVFIILWSFCVWFCVSCLMFSRLLSICFSCTFTKPVELPAPASAISLEPPPGSDYQVFEVSVCVAWVISACVFHSMQPSSQRFSKRITANKQNNTINHTCYRTCCHVQTPLTKEEKSMCSALVAGPICLPIWVCAKLVFYSHECM